MTNRREPRGRVSLAASSPELKPSESSLALQGIIARLHKSGFLIVATLLFGMALACQDSGVGKLVAPWQTQLTVAAEGDSDPQLCAAWQCRAVTYEEKAEMEANLDQAFYIYAADGRYACMSLVLGSRSTVENMTYVGTVQRWLPNKQGILERVIGETLAPQGSMYVDMGYMRQLGSVNGFLKTLIHEQFHLEDPNLKPIEKPGYDAEPPAIKAENDCTI